MDRVYICKNKHYFIVQPKQIDVECEFCRKKYMVNELEAINRKTSRFKADEQCQVLPAVT